MPDKLTKPLFHGTKSTTNLLDASQATNHSLQAQLDSVSPLPALEKLSKLFENQPYLHLIHQQEARYLLNEKQDSLALRFYDKSLQSPYADSSQEWPTTENWQIIIFKEGGYVKTGAYLDSLLREIPEEGRLKTNVQRERDGLDEVIALEQVIRSTDSITRFSRHDQRSAVGIFSKTSSMKSAPKN